MRKPHTFRTTNAKHEDQPHPHNSRATQTRVSLTPSSRQFDDASAHLTLRTSTLLSPTAENVTAAHVASYTPSFPPSLLLAMISASKKVKRNILSATTNSGRTALHFAAFHAASPAFTKILVAEFPEALLIAAPDLGRPLAVAQAAKTPDPALVSLLTAATDAVDCGDSTSLYALLGCDPPSDPIRVYAPTPRSARAKRVLRAARAAEEARAKRVLGERRERQRKRILSSAKREQARERKYVPSQSFRAMSEERCTRPNAPFASEKHQNEPFASSSFSAPRSVFLAPTVRSRSL